MFIFERMAQFGVCEWIFLIGLLALPIIALRFIFEDTHQYILSLLGILCVTIIIGCIGFEAALGLLGLLTGIIMVILMIAACLSSSQGYNEVYGRQYIQNILRN